MRTKKYGIRIQRGYLSLISQGVEIVWCLGCTGLPWAETHHFGEKLWLYKKMVRETEKGQEEGGNTWG